VHGGSPDITLLASPSSSSARFPWQCCRCCFGGQGCIRQNITGTGTGFLAAGGTILQKVIAPGHEGGEKGGRGERQFF
jgi:uncharacterized protein (AIM24 family)